MEDKIKETIEQVKVQTDKENSEKKRESLVELMSNLNKRFDGLEEKIKEEELKIDDLVQSYKNFFNKKLEQNVKENEKEEKKVTINDVINKISEEY